MGFSEVHASAALGACSGSVERAADWLFSHADDLDGAVAALSAQAGGSGGAALSGAGDNSSSAALAVDGAGVYKLRAMVSHIGKTTGSGHYVCHALKPVGGSERWVIFNDANVALSAQPPREHAYMYLYERI
jgi:ubiquitin carboxyl-terminal hydrolase 5/13